MIYMYIVKHKFILVLCVTILRHNYMFRPSKLVIFRLYMRNENLSIGYTNVSGGFIGCGEEGVGARSRLCQGKGAWPGAV